MSCQGVPCGVVVSRPVVSQRAMTCRAEVRCTVCCVAILDTLRHTARRLREGAALVFPFGCRQRETPPARAGPRSTTGLGTLPDRGRLCAGECKGRGEEAGGEMGGGEEEEGGHRCMDAGWPADGPRAVALESRDPCKL